MKVRYIVRVIEDGKVVEKESFKRESIAFAYIKDQIDEGKAARIRKQITEEDFHIESAEKWGRSAHAPYEYGPRPAGTVFFHTSVTTQLSETATVAQERAEMRKLDAIAKARGFNGISYSIVIFPSGRAYEGRGWGVIEAATAGYNTTSDSVCFAGNTDAFQPTRAQLESARGVLRDGQRHGYLVRRGLAIRGHREVAAKACPGRYVTPAILQQLEQSVTA